MDGRSDDPSGQCKANGEIIEIGSVAIITA